MAVPSWHTMLFKHCLQACASPVCGSRQAALHAELWHTILKHWNSFQLYIKQDSQAAPSAEEPNQVSDLCLLQLGMQRALQPGSVLLLF